MIKHYLPLTTYPSPASLTHQHLFSCLNTLIPIDASSVRILDAGCGNGKLISFIYQAIKFTRPEIIIDIHGFDVINHGVQLEKQFIEKTIFELTNDIPTVDWSERIKSLKIGDKWDFLDNYFDMVISNQVLEHVHNKPFFFKESYRVLRDNGYAIHLAPLCHYIYEGHLLLPFVHRICSHDLLRGYISFCSLLGLGKFREHNKLTRISRSEFSERHADYIYFLTKYASEKETLDMARNNGFRASFKFSVDFYLLKLRKTFCFPYKSSYKLYRSAIFDSIAIKFLRYISSNTLVCEKRNIYKN
ncbi:Class I SAM-dependent methyltransferase [Gammaproteobacteria bacterium]